MNIIIAFILGVAALLIPASSPMAGPTDISIDLFAVSGDEPISGATTLTACLSSSATTRSCLVEEDQTCDFEVGVCHTTVDISTLSLNGTDTLALWLTIDGDDLDPVTLSAVPWAQYCSVAGSVSDGIIVTADYANGSLTSVKTADDTFDLDKFEDTLDLDASTTFVADGSEVLTVTNGGTGNSFVVNDATSDTTPFTIDTSGNVGIGDSSPDASLEVFAPTSSDVSIFLTDGDVSHGMTSQSSGQADVFGGLTPISSTAGGMIVAGSSDTDAMGLILSGAIGAADPTDTVTAIRISGKRYDGATNTTTLDASETVLQVANNTTTLMTVLGNGDTGIGNATPPGRFIVSPPVKETIAEAAIITANACGTIKPIDTAVGGGGNVTTNTTNTFTAGSAIYNGCCMTVVNVDTTGDIIVLDDNANFQTTTGSVNINLSPGDAVRVCYSSDLGAWFQSAPLVLND